MMMTMMMGDDFNDYNNVDGGHHHRWNQDQPLQNWLVAEVLRQLLEGLAYFHLCGIVQGQLEVISAKARIFFKSYRSAPPRKWCQCSHCLVNPTKPWHASHSLGVVCLLVPGGWCSTMGWGRMKGHHGGILLNQKTYLSFWSKNSSET